MPPGAPTAISVSRLVVVVGGARLPFVVLCGANASTSHYEALLRLYTAVHTLTAGSHIMKAAARGAVGPFACSVSRTSYLWLEILEHRPRVRARV